MNDLLAFFTLRTFFVFFSTAFSILFIMLITGIITVDETIAILNLSPEAASAFKLVVSRVQEVTGNILEIISQLINKLFSWAGVDVDLNKIHVDIHHNGDAAKAAAEVNATANSAVEQAK